MPTPPPSPLISLSPPSAGERLARDDIMSLSGQPVRGVFCCVLSPYEVGESSTARPTGWGRRVPEIAPMNVGRGQNYLGYSGGGALLSSELVELHEHDTHDLYALLEDAQDGDIMDDRGGGLCFPRGLGSLNRIESGDPSGASDPP
ncbi:hypothetical protein Tco_1082312 [Tanacetum coccineum]|uniref:Uncharacterized protein n=1 Tax=Tanacetum coccineum TaxID=301880 RepID=A0ABQ5I061_9ASTR